MAKSPIAILFDTAGAEKGITANPVIVQGLGFGGQERLEFTNSSYVIVNHGLDGYPLKVTVLAQPISGGTGAFGVGGFGEGGFGEAGGEPDNYYLILTRGFSVRYIDENQFVVAMDAIRTGVVLYEV